MTDDTITLVLAITLDTGDKRRHSYPDVPTGRDAFHAWWLEWAKDIFSQTNMRPWLKLRNPTAFYQTLHIAWWEFESTGDERFEGILDHETDFQLRLA